MQPQTASRGLYENNVGTVKLLINVWVPRPVF